MLPVREIQNPQTRRYFLWDCSAAYGPVQVSASQLWLAVGILVAIVTIVFEHVYNSSADTERFCQLPRLDEIQVVGRGVVFGKATPDTAHETTNRKIESWGAILAFIVSVRRELQDFGRFAAMVKNMGRGAVDLRVAAAALLVVELAPVSEAREHQPMSNSFGFVSVSG